MPEADPWLVVGLGNPGQEYAANRHNLGSMVLDVLAARLGGRFRAARGRGPRAEVLETRLAGPAGPVRAVLAKPRTYMNESGGAVAAVRQFFQVPMERIVVVHDELDIPFGEVRLKGGGGAGGHNGLRSLTQSLGSPEYLRVRIGIGRPPGRMDPAVYVLRDFGTTERRDLGVHLERAADAVESLVREGLDASQNVYHVGR